MREGMRAQSALERLTRGGDKHKRADTLRKRKGAQSTRCHTSQSWTSIVKMIEQPDPLGSFFKQLPLSWPHHRTMTRDVDMSKPPIHLIVFILACAMLVYFVVHRMTRGTGSTPVATSPAAIAAPAVSGTFGEIKNFAYEAMKHALGACQPHLRSQQLRVPQIGVSQSGISQGGHIKMSLSVDDTGSVTDGQITAADFGLPSEQEAVLTYAHNLSFSVPRLNDCRGRHMEILGDVFEQRDRAGRWATMVRLYPRYALDAGGNLITRE